MSDPKNTHYFNGTSEFEVEISDENVGLTCQCVEAITYHSARYVKTFLVIFPDGSSYTEF